MGDTYVVLKGLCGNTLAKTTVAPVQKNLLSVTALVDTGHEVTFRKEQSYVWHPRDRTVAAKSERRAVKCTHLEEREDRRNVQGCRVCTTSQRADPSSLHTVSWMRLGELSCQTSEVEGHPQGEEERKRRERKPPTREWDDGGGVSIF